MKLLEPYESLDRTLIMMKRQVIDSLPFAIDFLPEGKMKPSSIFNFLKEETIYFSDPSGIELLQSMPTLFGNNNQHGIYGAGDCDCFTIAALASLIAKGYESGTGIFLVGRSKYCPVHIYASIYGVPFDLTNNKLGQERNYPYKQYLKFKI